jgi:hypothetical protein
VLRRCADHVPVRTVELIRHHHEWFDGTGYPDGLASEAIPLGARVFAVADSFDAMTSDRPYRGSIGPERALAESGRLGTVNGRVGLQMMEDDPDRRRGHRPRARSGGLILALPGPPP